MEGGMASDAVVDGRIAVLDRNRIRASTYCFVPLKKPKLLMVIDRGEKLDLDLKKVGLETDDAHSQRLRRRLEEFLAREPAVGIRKAG